MRFRDLRTTAEIAELYRFPTREAVRKFLRSHGVPYIKRGRVLLIDTRDMDAACSRAWDTHMRRMVTR
jgi:hypothetical protein